MSPQEGTIERPRFTSASLYNSPDGLLSFWYATEWQLQESDSPCRSIVLTPDPQDPATNITIEVHDLQTSLLRRERRLILEGVKAGLAQLEDCRIIRLEELDQSGRWGLEWECTFISAGQRRRRRARLYFSDHYQYSVTLQGSTEERYAYWQGMFEFTLLTVGTANFSVLGFAQSAAAQQEG